MSIELKWELHRMSCRGWSGHRVKQCSCVCICVFVYLCLCMCNALQWIGRTQIAKAAPMQPRLLRRTLAVAVLQCTVLLHCAFALYFCTVILHCCYCTVILYCYCCTVILHCCYCTVILHCCCCTVILHCCCCTAALLPRFSAFSIHPSSAM